MTAPRRRWMTVEQAARELGVSKMTVYRLVETEELRAYRISRRINIDPRDLAAYLRNASTFTWERDGGGAA